MSCFCAILKKKSIGLCEYFIESLHPIRIITVRNQAGNRETYLLKQLDTVKACIDEKLNATVTHGKLSGFRVTVAIGEMVNICEVEAKRRKVGEGAFPPLEQIEMSELIVQPSDTIGRMRVPDNIICFRYESTQSVTSVTQFTRHNDITSDFASNYRIGFRCLCDTIAKMHELNITHNDIKTDNILFTRLEIPGTGFYYVKLIDFGSLFDFDRVHDMSDIAYTSLYVSPFIISIQSKLRIQAGNVEALPFCCAHDNWCLLQVLYHIKFRSIFIRDIFRSQGSDSLYALWISDLEQVLIICEQEFRGDQPQLDFIKLFIIPDVLRGGKMMELQDDIRLLMAMRYNEWFDQNIQKAIDYEPRIPVVLNPLRGGSKRKRKTKKRKTKKRKTKKCKTKKRKTKKRKTKKRKINKI